MTELKTLNDITDPVLPYCARKDELKQEAIKWIKFNEKAEKENYKLPDRMGQHYGSLNEGAIIFIKHFFNITEEDLK